LFLFTDGVTEAFNASDEAYDEKRLEALLPKLAGKDSQSVIDGVLADVRDFVVDAPQSDDITMLVVKRKG
jgi:sigma-B regulation protein RsbU (phosphoserine phosphatase)